MIKKETQLCKVYEYIYKTYGNRPFTTGKIYKDANKIGVSSTSVSSNLNQLKEKGILTNSYGKRTKNGHIQKIWCLVKEAEIV